MSVKTRKQGLRYWRNLFLFAIGVFVIGGIAVVYVLLPVSYANSIAHPARASVCCRTPADIGLRYNDVSFVTADGITLHGWYIPTENGAAVIIAHGIGGNRVAHLEQGGMLTQHGYGVLLLDLRAHGESGGDTTSFGQEDIVAAVAYLHSRDDVQANRVGVMGVSLGGLVALEAAASTESIRAVVAEGAAPNSFRDLPTPRSLGHWLDLPFQWVTFQVWERAGIPGPLPVTEAIEKIAPRPVLLISGTESAFEQGLQRKLYAAAGEGSELWEVNVGHGQCWKEHPEEYETQVVSFYNRALLGR